MRFLIVFAILIVFSMLQTRADQVDIGIFESQTTPKKIEVRIRPDFNIGSTQTLTGVLYTVRWDDPAVTITTDFIYPFFVSPQGSPVLHNGYYYQVFAAVPMIAVAMNANQELLLSSFSYTNGDCTLFEIIEDNWTQSNNGNVYLELVGWDVTGIIYQAIAAFGSIGGFIQGADTITFGNPTGPMTLSDFNGNVIYWERKSGDGEWMIIPGSAGVISFSETPPTIGYYFYRVLIQNGICPFEYSEEHTILFISVVSLNLKVFLEGAYEEGEMMSELNELDILPKTQPYAVPPWNYFGSESVNEIPESAVDWVLIELRGSSGGASDATPDKTIGYEAGFLLKNGSIKKVDGISSPDFMISTATNLYIIVHHRNHIPVISANPVPILNDFGYYDFSFSENGALGGNLGHKQIAPGIWGMAAGDANADRIIDMDDKQTNWETESGSNGYLQSDFSMDSQVDNIDKNDFWLINQGFQSQVPE